MRDKEQARQEVKEAMLKLGYSQFAVNGIHLHWIDNDRVKVLYTASVFGIYDFIKHTFVD